LISLCFNLTCANIRAARRLAGENNRGRTMKIRIVLALFAAAALLGGCDKKEEGGGDAKSASAEKKDGAAAGGTGVKECDDYFAAVEKCAKSMPAEAKGAIEQAAKTMKDSLNGAGSDEAKKAMASGCKQAADALSSNPACK
jgi:hypothetical protein